MDIAGAAPRHTYWKKETLTSSLKLVQTYLIVLDAQLLLFYCHGVHSWNGFSEIEKNL